MAVETYNCTDCGAALIEKQCAVLWEGGPPLRCYTCWTRHKAKVEEAATRVMGWHKGKGGAIIGLGFNFEDPNYWYDANGVLQAPCVDDVFANLVAWEPKEAE
jgi:hypothetical protein